MNDHEIFDEANNDIGPMQMLSYAFCYMVVAAVAVGLVCWIQAC